jgi:4-hydroxy-3-polyprenylbenzoate decarboxylase
VRVFLGITGASGAPYAKRLLESLAATDCNVGLSASSAAIEVAALERYGDAPLSRDEVLARLVDGLDDVTVHDPNDWRAPYASGSAKVDADVVCPCSSGTLGAIASGLTQNLVQRAAAVAAESVDDLVDFVVARALDQLELEHSVARRGGDA